MHLEEMIRKSKMPYPQGKLEVAALVVTLAFILFGILHSVIDKNWQHLGQVGSLIVISGILLAWQDIVGNLDRYVELIKSHSVDKMELSPNSNESKAQISPLEIAKREINAFDESMIKYLKMRRYRLRTTEALLLIFGTFIGSYGADIGSCVYKFG